MIGRLEGRLQQLEPGLVLVDVGGVGYVVATSLRAVQQLAAATTAALWIHTQVRDDAITLFGFPERDELAAFEQLIAVAGVGPRLALAVLSSLSAAELADVVERGDVARLVATPGVGRKTANRILLELKGRLTPSSAALPGDLGADAVSGLSNLGYAEKDAAQAVAAVVAEHPELELGELLRRALQLLTR